MTADLERHLYGLLSETNCDNTYNIFAWTTRVGIRPR